MRANGLPRTVPVWLAFSRYITARFSTRHKITLGTDHIPSCSGKLISYDQYQYSYIMLSGQHITNSKPSLSSVEINVTIICSCMPSFASYLNKPFQKLRSFTSRYFYPSRKYGTSRSRHGAVPLDDVEPAQVQDDKMKLTLGSAVRGGKFLHISQQETRSTSPIDEAHESDAEERRPVEV